MFQGITKVRAFKAIFRTTVLAVVLYAAFVAALYKNQHQFIFFPLAEPTGAPAEYGLKKTQAVELHTDDGLTLTDWFTPPADTKGYVIVVFHGSMITIGGLAPLARRMAQDKKGLMFCEYRGFGGAPGVPTEQGVYKDARAAIKWLESEGYDPNHLIYYGGSLGTGVAVQMAIEKPPALLVLHSPYSSVADVIKSIFPFFPVDTLLDDRFDSIDKISKVHAPLLIVHGTDDDVIPFRMAVALYKATNAPKLFYVVKGGHHIDVLFSSAILGMINQWIDKRLKTVTNGR